MESSELREEKENSPISLKWLCIDVQNQRCFDKSNRYSQEQSSHQ